MLTDLGVRPLLLRLGFDSEAMLEEPAGGGCGMGDLKEEAKRPGPSSLVRSLARRCVTVAKKAAMDMLPPATHSQLHDGGAVGLLAIDIRFNGPSGPESALNRQAQDAEPSGMGSAGLCGPAKIAHLRLP